MKLTPVLTGVAVLSIIIAGGLYVDKVYVPPEAPPEILYTIKGPVVLHHDVQEGDLVTAPNLGSIYYVSSDMERLPFPDEQTFLSWYPDYTKVKTVTKEKLESMQLAGRNVTLRAGTHLVTIQSSSQVWAVTHPKSLMWFGGGEEQVIDVYGESWQDRLVDIQEYFFTNYILGPDVGDGGVTYPIGTVIYAKNTDKHYLVTGLQQRIITPKGFKENNFQERFVVVKDDPIDLDLVAPALDEYEPMWSSPDVQTALLEG